MILISEIFGPVIQGEGAHIGEPTVFVRVGGCDYRCSWCDSMYAVDPKYKHDWRPMETWQVADAIRGLTHDKPILVTLSGGNPAIYDFGELIRSMQKDGYTFTIETQGSFARAWFSNLDSMTISPKPPSSGMHTDLTRLSDCVAYLPLNKVSLKIVVADDADYEYARTIASHHPLTKMYLQVCNPKPGYDAVCDAAPLIDKLKWLSERVLRDQWFDATVLPQLHVLMYGNQRGT